MWVNLESIYLSSAKVVRTQKPHSTCFHLYYMSGGVKSIELQSQLEVVVHCCGENRGTLGMTGKNWLI